MDFTFLPLSSEPSFMVCSLSLIAVQQECPIHAIGYNAVLRWAPERPLLKSFYQAVTAEIIAKPALEFFNCLYPKYLISGNCRSTH